MKILRFGAIWCPSCLVMKSRWEKIKRNHQDVTIMDYDYDEAADLVKFHHVGTLLPVLIFEENGEEIHRITGEKSVKELEKMLEGFGI